MSLSQLKRCSCLTPKLRSTWMGVSNPEQSVPTYNLGEILFGISPDTEPESADPKYSSGSLKKVLASFA